MASVVLPRICRSCGNVFPGGPRAWYCPDCRAIRQREASARFRAKGRVADRPIGSIDTSTICGEEYVVNSAHQRYCPKCAPEAYRVADRPFSKQWNAEHKDTYYPAKNAKRNAQRKADPETVRAKERDYWAKNRDKLAAKNKRAAEKRKAKSKAPGSD